MPRLCSELVQKQLLELPFPAFPPVEVTFFLCLCARVKISSPQVLGTVKVQYLDRLLQCAEYARTHK